MTTAKHRNHLSDLLGASRLAIDATRGLADLVEAMHHNISRAPAILEKTPAGRTRGITGLVYRSVHGVTRLVGGSIDAVLGSLAPLLGHVEPSPARTRTCRRKRWPPSVPPTPRTLRGRKAS